jgi:hypothetical protein
MGQGPNEARLLSHLEGAEPGEVDSGADEWQRCAELLREVSRAIRLAAMRDEQIGGETGPAMGQAFTRTATSIGDRSTELLKGEGALRKAAKAIRQANQGKQKMEQEYPALDHPGSYQRPVGPLKPEELEEQANHQAAITRYNETYAAREKASEYWAQHMDDTFDASAAVMKEIHGEPDPERPGGDGGGPRKIPTTPGTPQGPGDPSDSDPRDEDPRDEDPRDDDPRDEDPRDDGRGDDSGSDDESGDTPPGYTDHDTDSGGLSTGTLGGLAAGVGGGALALGGLRGGLLPSALSSSGVRPIGSTGRVGASGALGRGGALAPGSPVSRTGAAAGRGVGAGGIGTQGQGKGNGRGTGGRGTGRGGRAGVGGVGTGRGGRAGAGGIGTGRGRGKKDEEKKQAPRDLFDDGEDWIDDEGAAPDVLD